MQLYDLSIRQLIEHPLTCSCGMIHQTNFKKMIVESNAISKLPSLLEEFQYKKPFFITDHKTMEACGKLVHNLLVEKQIAHCFFELPMKEVHPDEWCVGSILMAFDTTCDSIIAIGSGTINDLSRFTSYKLGLPYSVIGTAPSMDGYVSNVAAMTTNQMKTTYPAHVPEFILSDLDILCQAPYDLITAGFGDIMGKFTCIADWELSHLINGEYYCEEIAGLIKKARDLTLSCKDTLMERSPESVLQLMNALVLSGVGMSFAGISRPASGSEHHLSHFWEMRYLFEGREPIFHGTKVAIGTIASLKLYELLKEYLSNGLTITDYTYDHATWRKNITTVFRNAAPEVLKLEDETKKNGYSNWLIRTKATAEHIEQIKELVSCLPTANDMVQVLKTIHAPFRPSEIGLDRELVYEAILYAKEVRNRYTILQFLWDSGLLEEFATKTTDYLFSL